MKLFADTFDKRLNAVNRKCGGAAEAPINQQEYSLSTEQWAEVQASLEAWRVQGKVQRLWARDKSLWTNSDEADWLGWLDVTEEQLKNIQSLSKLAEDVKSSDFSHALLLGMGGSSLCPEVLKLTFGKMEGFPELHVLDSTDPAQVRTFEGKVDLAKTLFIVSSKSGTTIEPNIFKDYFFHRVRETVGPERAGRHFLAITDPGSKLEAAAAQEEFRRVFAGSPSIGGRYSALSNFGMVPAAVMGLDVGRFLKRADEMAAASSSRLAPDENPGVVLGTILGVLARRGRDKVTLIHSPGLWGLGAWLEQLLAESTGKDEEGLIPVDREPLGPPEVYGNDRVFVYGRLETAPDPAQDAAVSAIEKAGVPVIWISIEDPYNLGQEFFRWEIATATAGSILKINPFDQPDVEASKIAARALTDAFEDGGELPVETPIFEEGGIQLFTDERNAKVLSDRAGKSPSFDGYLLAHLNSLRPGDYFALLAYIEMNVEHEAELQEIRRAVRDRHRVATCLGFGPRFLHSTGQAYKGGPNTGVFLQITCEDAEDLPVSGKSYTFGIVKAAQARGDFQVLVERGRRTLRIHLGPDVAGDLKKLRSVMDRALKE